MPLSEDGGAVVALRRDRKLDSGAAGNTFADTNFVMEDLDTTSRIILLACAAFPVAVVVARMRNARKTAYFLGAVSGLVWLLAAMALPSSVSSKKMSRKHQCGANLKQIDGAIQQWALEHKKEGADTYSLSDPALLAHLKGSQLPSCPGGGQYLPGNNIAGVPRCSLAAAEGHTL